MWIVDALSFKLSQFVVEQDCNQLNTILVNLFYSQSLHDLEFEQAGMIHLASIIQHHYNGQRLFNNGPVSLSEITKDLLAAIIISQKAVCDDAIWNIDFLEIMQNPIIAPLITCPGIAPSSFEPLYEFVNIRQNRTDIRNHIRSRIKILMCDTNIKILVDFLDFNQGDSIQRNKVNHILKLLKITNFSFSANWVDELKSEVKQALDEKFLRELKTTVKNEILTRAFNQISPFFHPKEPKQPKNNSNSSRYLHQLPYRVASKQVLADSITSLEAGYHLKLLNRIEIRYLHKIGHQAGYSKDLATDFLLEIATSSQQTPVKNLCLQQLKCLHKTERWVDTLTRENLPSCFEADTLIKKFMLNEEIEKKAPTFFAKKTGNLTTSPTRNSAPLHNPLARW